MLAILIFFALLAASTWAGWTHPRHRGVVVLCASVCLTVGIFDSASSGGDMAALGVTLGTGAASLCVLMAYAAHVIDRMTRSPRNEPPTGPR